MKAIDVLSRLVFQSKAFLVILILINLAGTTYGFYYYQQDFSEFPFYLWLLVSDSPIAVLLFAFFLALFLAGRRNGLLEALAFIGLFKVGLWTSFIILLYKEYFLQPSYLYWYGALFLLHLGMVLQSVVMMPIMKIRRNDALMAGTFYLLNDFSDYLFNLVPRRDIIIPGSGGFYIVALESFLATLILSYFLLKKSRA